MADTVSPNESKLLWLPNSCEASKLFLRNQRRAIAIQIGANCCNAVLIDTADAKQLLIFHLSFTDSRDCLTYLLNNRDNKDDQLEMVLANQLSPEFSAEVLKFSKKSQVVNYFDQLLKAVPLIPDLVEHHPHELFYLTEEEFEPKFATSHWSLIDSNKTEIRIIRVSPGNGCYGSCAETLPNSSALHSQLSATKRSLATRFLLSPASTAQAGSVDDGFLTDWLRKLANSEQPENFHQDFASIVDSTLSAFAAAIELELRNPNKDEQPSLVAISDGLFAHEYCRKKLIDEIGTDKLATPVCIKFIRDAGFLGMLGALLSCC